MKWTPVDYAILLLTLMVSVTFMITAILPIILQEPISDARSKVLGGIATSVVSVISVYVGAKIQKHREKDKE